MAERTDLIARLEALTVPDRKVDAEIGVILHIHPPGGGWLSHEYTRSLDAAVALCERVLPDWVWQVSRLSADVWDGMNIGVTAYHKIPAIALLIATLKALDTKETAND